MKSHITLALLGVLVCVCFAGLRATTLAHIESYASTVDELPQPDNENLLNPIYNRFHVRSAPGLWKKLLWTLGFEKRPFFSVDTLKATLERVVHMREQEAYSSNRVCKIADHVENSFVIFGDVQGAFHSLVRDLRFLHDRGVLTSDLLITKPHCYFIFNGDVINRSPHILETLLLVVMLMEKNPNRVFYIRGNHESLGHWQDFGLRRELLLRAAGLTREKVPLERLVEDFFGTLPRAVYIESKLDQQSVFVRISHEGFDSTDLDERFFSDKLLQNVSEPTYFDAVGSKKGQRVSIPVIIKAQPRSMHYEKTDGLTLAQPDRGATAWSLLSSPTKTYRMLYDFFNDAFCIVHSDSDLNKWTIELYKQDAREHGGFKRRLHNLVTGIRISSSGDRNRNKKEQDVLHKIQATLEQQVVLGSSMDLSRTSALLGKRLRQGLSLRLNEQNKKLVGRFIKFILLDDKYTPYRTRKNIAQLSQDYGADILVSPLGTPTTLSLLPLIRSGELLTLFPYSGSSKLRMPHLTHLFNFRTSYSNEVRALLSYAVDVLHAKRFAFFYQNDDYGKEPLATSRAVLKKHGIESWIEAPYVRNSVDVKEAAEKIADFSPDVILFYSTYAPSVALVRELGIRDNLAHKKLMGISFLTDMFRDFLRGRGLDLIISRVVPDPTLHNIPLLKQYRLAMSAANPKAEFNVDSLEGYINMSIVIDALSKVVGDPTKEKLAAVLESYSNYDLDGINLTFDPRTREFSKDVWVDAGERPWTHYSASHTEQKRDKPPVAGVIDRLFSR